MKKSRHYVLLLVPMPLALLSKWFQHFTSNSTLIVIYQTLLIMISNKEKYAKSKIE